MLVDTGSAILGDQQLVEGELGLAPLGPPALEIIAGEDGARLVLIGGEPLGEQIVMWWNFIARTHDEIVEYRNAYQHEIETGEVGRFGPFPAGQPAAIPAPKLPNAHLRPRG